VARPSAIAQPRPAPVRDDKTEAARVLYRTLQTRIDEAKTLDDLEAAIPDPVEAHGMIEAAAPGTFAKLIQRRELKRKTLAPLAQRVAEQLGT